MRTRPLLLAITFGLSFYAALFADGWVWLISWLVGLLMATGLVAVYYRGTDRLAESFERKRNEPE